MEQILSLKSVVKVYPPNHRAVNDITLDVTKHKHILIVGEAEAGKTTLLKLVGGIISPDSGTVKVCGTQLAELNENNLAQFRVKNIGIAGTGIGLIKELSITENILLPYTINNTRTSDIEKYAREIILNLGLEPVSESSPCMITGFQRCLSCIARAIITRPSLLLFDDVETSLTEHEREKFWGYVNVISQFTDATIIFFSDHSLDSSLIYRKYRIKFGKIEEVNR